MKKMPYAIIFIIIVALLVFAGCRTLIEQPSEEISSDDITSGSEEFSSEPSYEDPSNDEPSSPGEEPGSSSGSNEQQSSSEPTSTAAPSETATSEPPSSDPPAVSINEYDILRSGHFYLDGTMYADGESTPITLAISDNVVYMQSTADGATMGFLISNGNTYLLNPAEKTYCEFGSLLSGFLSQAGMMSQEEIMESINEMGFGTMEDLSAANEKTAATMNGAPCTAYIFNNPDGTSMRVYMNEGRLLGFESLTANGTVDSATYINVISSDIPTLPPQDYKKQNIISFITSLESILGD